MDKRKAAMYMSAFNAALVIANAFWASWGVDPVGNYIAIGFFYAMLMVWAADWLL